MTPPGILIVKALPPGTTGEATMISKTRLQGTAMAVITVITLAFVIMTSH